MKKSIFLLTILMQFWFVYSQEKGKNYVFGGFLSQMQQTVIDSLNGNWTNDQFLQNRVKFEYFGKKNFDFKIEARTRLIYGETVKNTPSYANYLDEDKNFADLSFNIFSGKSYVLNTNIDRAYVHWQKNKVDLTAGRQRINWAMTMVWNPNDVFNNYSFFDFDYAEKPGVDAVDFRYSFSYASNLEVAAKLNSDTALTTAVKYLFNKWKYDFQFIGGILDEEDIFAGLGWSGNIKNLGFVGEMTYLQPKDNFFDTSGVFIASTGLNYMFDNGSLFVCEFLFNQAAKGINLGNIYQISTAPSNVKQLSFSKYNALVQYSYPVTPLINISMTGMYMSEGNLMFFMPQVSFSIADNVDFTSVGQIFSGNIKNPATGKDEQKIISFLFFRLKYSW